MTNVYYTFHAREFKKFKHAEKAFFDIHEVMLNDVPDMFATLSRLEEGGYAILIGCHDDDAAFMDKIEKLWDRGNPVEIDMDVWMGLEASHSRQIAEYAESDGEEDFVNLRQDVRINPDGTDEDNI